MSGVKVDLFAAGVASLMRDSYALACCVCVCLCVSWFQQQKVFVGADASIATSPAL